LWTVPSGDNSLVLHSIFYTEFWQEEQLFYKLPATYQLLLITFTSQTGSGQLQHTDGHLAGFITFFSGKNWWIMKACHLY
jgi:hypothetical protein